MRAVLLAAILTLLSLPAAADGAKNCAYPENCGGAQTPWTESVDAAGFDLDNVEEITSGIEAEGGTFNIKFQGTNGLGINRSCSESSLDSFIGGTRNTLCGEYYNYNEAGTSPDNAFNPAAYLPGLETNYLQQLSNGPWAEVHWGPQRAKGVATVASATGFADETFILIREPSDGEVVAWGWLNDITATTVTIYWYYLLDKTNIPVQTDEIESTSSTTVTSRFGAFTTGYSANHLVVWVYGSGTCGADGTTAVGRLIITTSAADLTSSPNDIDFIQYQGSDDDLVSGRCIRQGTTTALLGTVTKSAASTINSAWTTSNETIRSFTGILDYRDLESVWQFYPTKGIYDAGIPSLSVGQVARDAHWVRIASGWTDDGGLGASGFVGALGSPGYLKKLVIHGGLSWFDSADGSNPYDRVDVESPAVITGVRSQEWSDTDGSIVAISSSALTMISIVGDQDDASTDTGTEVCALAGLVCVGAAEIDGTELASCATTATGSTSGYFHAFCRGQ